MTAIFTIPAGEPFLQRLAQALIEGDLPVPGGKAPNALELPDTTLLLPTRRAARALQDAFLSVSAQPSNTICAQVPRRKSGPMT